MKAILLKELRENARWALLMLVALALLMMYRVSSGNEPPLISGAMFTITMFGFSAAGFILGMLQVLQDRRRGRWGFLIHRPIGRTRVFFAKVIAGILLYVGVTAIPLAATVWWVATPGHVAAPFDWVMVAPRVADLIGGIAWYFAGFFAAARNARWIGSRLFPAGLTFIASILVTRVALNLAEAVLIDAAAILLLLPAAWGAFVAGGELEAASMPIRLTQGLSVTAGVVVAYMVAAGLAIGLVETLGYDTVIYSPQYTILADGRIVRQLETKDGTTQITDPQGHPLTDLTATLVAHQRLATSDLNLSERDPAKMRWSELAQMFGLQSSAAYAQVLYSNEQHVVWFYVASRQMIEGFNTATRRFLGSIGPHGFAPADQTPEAFPERFVNQQFYSYNSIKVGKTTAYNVDLTERTAKLLFTATADDPILDAAEYRFGDYPSTIYHDTEDFIVTRSNIWVIEDGKPSFNIPLAYTHPDYAYVEMGWASSGKLIMHYVASDPLRKPRLLDQVVTVDRHGQITDRTELPSLDYQGPNEPQWLELSETAAVPPALLAFLVYVERRNPDQNFPVRAVAIELVVIGCVSAVAAMLVMRRYDSRRGATPTWMAICFVLGISGLLLLISLRQWVAREACPACKRLRLVSRERCEHCGEGFAPPERVGIEIFEIGMAGAAAAQG